MASTYRTNPTGWRIWVGLLLGFAMVLANAWTGLAQAGIESPATGDSPEARILQLRLQVMPEFDDPRVLVVGQGRLAGGETNAPRDVSFWIPENAQVNLITGMGSAETELVSQPYSLQPDPDRPGWSLLTSKFDSAHFFYEYYYPGLESDPDRSDRKSFDFIFSSPNEVESLSLELQQPLGASNFSSDPPPRTTRQDASYGFSYHLLERGPLASGQPLAVRVSYTKTNSEPSISRLVIAPVSLSPSGDGTADMGEPTFPHNLGAAARGVLSGMVLLLGIAAAAAVVIFRRRSSAETAVLLEAEPDYREGHCPICGQTQRPGAFYCYRCGCRLDRKTSQEPDPHGWAKGTEISPRKEGR